MSGLFVEAPAAMTVVAWVGAATAFLGATMGVTQFNLKKVLAYSTISQLGFMVMACGLGAFSVGLFHLVTHAFFKACLFLGAGAVLHALHGEEDMRHMGGLAVKLPFTFATFLVATLALCGIPPFAGFFSKDEILWHAWLSADGVPWLWLVGIATSGLTAYYMFRAIHLTFFGPSRVAEASAHGVHEPPMSMAAVLGVLALGSLLVGFLGLPGVWREFIGVSAPFYEFLAPALAPVVAAQATHATELWLMAIAVLVAVAGILAAQRRFGRGRGRETDAAPGMVHSLVENGYYFDTFYNRVIVRSIDWVSASVLARGLEVALARISLGAPTATVRFASTLFTRLQTGNVQTYAFYALAGLAVTLLWAATRA